MSCLFNSLSYFLNDNAFNIRQKICDYLQNNEPIMEGLDTKFILELESPNYIENMRCTQTWGGAIEIQSACNIWDIKIFVKNIRDNTNNKDIEFLPINNSNSNNEKSPIFLEWSGGHYEPVK